MPRQTLEEKIAVAVAAALAAKSNGGTAPTVAPTAPPPPPANPLLPIGAGRPTAPKEVIQIDPAKLTRGEVSQPKETNWKVKGVAQTFQTVDYTYGLGANGAVQHWSAFAHSKATAVGELVLVGPDGRGMLVNEGEDSFTVLRMLPCKAGNYKGESVRVSARDFPTALSMLNPTSAPVALPKIARTAIPGAPKK